MIQWVGVLLTVLGLAYTGLKDYQKGDIKIPTVQKDLTAVKYPIQYCLMAYDPNLDKVFYLHENGQWYYFPPEQRKYSTVTSPIEYKHDYAPQQRRYSTTPQLHQNQSQKAVGIAYGSQGTQGYYLR